MKERWEIQYPRAWCSRKAGSVIMSANMCCLWTCSSHPAYHAEHVDIKSAHEMYSCSSHCFFCQRELPIYSHVGCWTVGSAPAGTHHWTEVPSLAADNTFPMSRCWGHHPMPQLILFANLFCVLVVNRVWQQYLRIATLHFCPCR